MLDRLPVELVLQIFDTAACFDSRAERRQVVDIALVSRAAYQGVAPRLYRLFVATSPNNVPFLTRPGAISLLERVLPHVRCMHIDGEWPLSNDSDDFDPDLPSIALHKAVASLFAAWRPKPGAALCARVAWLKLFQETHPEQFKNISRISLVQWDAFQLVRGLEALHDPKWNLTHVTGHITPYSRPERRLEIAAQDWVDQLLELCPNVIHWRFIQREGSPIMEETWDMNVWVLDAIKRLLAARPKTACVVLDCRWRDLVDIGGQMHPALLPLLKEPRVILSRSSLHVGDADRIWSDMDVWERYFSLEGQIAKGQYRYRDTNANTPPVTKKLPKNLHDYFALHQ